MTVVLVEAETTVSDRDNLDKGTFAAADAYTHSHAGRTLLAITTSVLPFLALWAAMAVSVNVSYLLTLALAVPTAGFLIRTYILMHDCVHGSLLPSRRGNALLGAVLGLASFTPFARWRYEHLQHHATAGDLDRRGAGDVKTLTAAEYLALSPRGRLGYRLFRNPVIMFGLGPLFGMLVQPRRANEGAPPQVRRSIRRTNVVLVLVIAALCWLVGWRTFLLVELPLVPLAGGVGIWLFYVQHQFDSTYWRRGPSWSFTDAALTGSSYLDLPRVLHFFSGNIGYHHVHHLRARVPSYYLPRAHAATPAFHAVQPVSLWEGMRATRLKVYDEDAGRLVTWRELRTKHQA